jgi:hypothetical protein
MSQWKPPGWGRTTPGEHPAHVLVEDDHPALRLSDFGLFRNAGMVLAYCSGPSGQCCPLLEGGACALVDGADVVLHALDPELGVAEAIADRRPDLPVVRVVARRGRGAPAGSPFAAVLDRSCSVDGQIRALRRALARVERDPTRESPLPAEPRRE